MKITLKFLLYGWGLGIITAAILFTIGRVSELLHRPRFEPYATYRYETDAFLTFERIIFITGIPFVAWLAYRFGYEIWQDLRGKK